MLVMHVPQLIRLRHLTAAWLAVSRGYVTYEMGAAVWKAAQGQTEDTKAAYAWDEAAAFYVGNVETRLRSSGHGPFMVHSPGSGRCSVWEGTRPGY